MNGNSSLVDAFRDGYMAEMSAQSESQPQTTPEETLEKLEKYEEIGWEENAKEEARQFQEETGIEVSELANKADINLDTDLSDLTTEGGSLVEAYESEHEFPSEGDYDAHEALQKMDAYREIGWNASLQNHAEEFQEETGVDVEELAQDAGISL